MIRILLVAFLTAFAGAFPAAAAEKPNIVLLLADDLGYGDIGCYGQKQIATPHIDRMAAEGLRFTQFYAGSTVCAPSRSVLMTGQHTGHTTVRGNAGQRNPAAQTLRRDDVTVASVLKSAGYATALFGKWGLGDEPDGTGHPLKHGFDTFYGYLSQHHAHNHFPDFLWRDSVREPLPNDLVPLGQEGSGAGYSTNQKVFADDLFADEAVKFIGAHKEQPFFLYVSFVIPHANNERTRALGDGQEVPDYGAYADKPWPQPDRGQAAMIGRLDSYVGRIRQALKDAGVAGRTLVLFSSDNGPHREGGNRPEFFDANGPVRGIKRDLTDGGIRVPFIAAMPGTVPAGETGAVGYFGDLMATAAELAGAPLPERRDSISLVPTLTGKSGQQSHPVLYWEFHERGTSQAVILDGRWKGIRESRQDAPVQIYDLQTDMGEEHDLAATRPELVQLVADAMKAERAESPEWPLTDAPPAKKRKSAAARKKNILFILADDLGWRDLSGEGSTFYQSPRIDSLAASGMKFTRGYAACQVCSPSRASILLGKYPARHHITDWIGAASGQAWKRNGKILPVDYLRALPAEDTTLAEAFQEAGYATFFAGKWHLGGKGSRPEDHGFQVNVGGHEAGSPPGGYFSPYQNPAMKNGPPGESLPHRLAEETGRFIEAHRDEPFLAYLSFYSVHGPIQTTEALWRKYREKAAAGAAPDHRFAIDRTLPVRQVQDCPVYAGMIESMDSAVGLVLDKLEALGLAEDTIVVFTSDNGGVSSGDAFATSNLPLRGGKGRQWEGGLREPFYLRAPGITKPGSTSATPVIHTDFYPTLLELAGLPLRPAQHRDGQSLVPLLTGKSIPGRPLLWHYPHYGNQGGEPSSILLLDDWKLIHYYEDGRDELYHLATDPGETTDLTAREPEKAKTLRARLDALLTETGATLPAPDPRFDPAARTAENTRILTRTLPALEKQHADFLRPDWQPDPTWWKSRQPDN